MKYTRRSKNPRKGHGIAVSLPMIALYLPYMKSAVLDAIAAIERYASLGRQAFDNQELIQVWIVHHLQIIGEATNALSSELTSRYSQVPWAQIVAFRNLVVHEYFRVSLNLVWAIVQNNLPPLKVTVQQILQELPEV